MGITTTINKPEATILPLPPTAEEKDKFEMEIYAKFMRHLRCVPNSRTEIKVLSAIQFTADMMDCDDALIAKVLVDLGLRAPRCAFPASYLEFVDASLMRACWNEHGLSETIRSLRDYWDSIGEDLFAFARRSEFAVYQETSFTSI